MPVLFLQFGAFVLEFGGFAACLLFLKLIAGQVLFFQFVAAALKLGGLGGSVGCLALVAMRKIPGHHICDRVFPLLFRNAAIQIRHFALMFGLELAGISLFEFQQFPQVVRADAGKN